MVELAVQISGEFSRVGSIQRNPKGYSGLQQPRPRSSNDTMSEFEVIDFEDKSSNKNKIPEVDEKEDTSFFKIGKKSS